MTGRVREDCVRSELKGDGSPPITFEVGQNGCISGKTILYENVYTFVRTGEVRD